MQQHLARAKHLIIEVHCHNLAQRTLPHNLNFIKALEELAKKKQCSLAQLSLAWLLAQGDSVIPIPGTSHLDYLKENIGAIDVNLSPDDLKMIQQLMKEHPIKGARYPYDEPFITWDRK